LEVWCIYDKFVLFIGIWKFTLLIKIMYVDFKFDNLICYELLFVVMETHKYNAKLDDDINSKFQRNCFVNSRQEGYECYNEYSN